MLKRIVTFLKYGFFLGLGIFLLWWQFSSMSDDERREFYAALSGTNYWLILPVLLMSLLSHFSRSMRWKLLMEPLGYKPALKNAFAVTMVGYLANSFIPRLGEVLKCSMLGRYEQLKFDKLFGTVIVERIFDFICYLVFIGITVLIQINLIGGYVKEKIEAMGSGSGFPFWAKLLLIIAGCILIWYLLKFLARRFPNNKIVSKTNQFLSGIGDGFKTIKTLKKRGQFLAHTVFIWAMYVLQIYLGFFSMEGTSGLGINAAFAVLSLATLAMIATPGGLGSFPVFVMETLLIYSISSPVGKAFGWLIWGANTAIILVFGIIAFLALPYLNKTRHEAIPGHTV